MNKLVGLTEAQVVWASNHDWFKCVQVWDGIKSVWVRQEDVLASGEVCVSDVEFADFEELRDWAGY